VAKIGITARSRAGIGAASHDIISRIHFHLAKILDLLDRPVTELASLEKRNA